MGEINQIDREMAKQGILVTHPGPLPYSKEEWIKWLNYIPDFQQQRIDYLSSKQATELSGTEIEELLSLRKQLKMKIISNKFESKDTCLEDRLEYISYTTQGNLDVVIRTKLTTEEYNGALVKIQEIIDSFSYQDLNKYCKSKIEQFDSLSMTELFILREVTKKFLSMSNEKTEKELKYQLDSIATIKSGLYF